MRGRSDAAKRDADNRTALAYATAYFTRTDKKVRLADYLISARKKVSSPAEMLEIMREFQARGANMKFRQIH